MTNFELMRHSLERKAGLLEIPKAKYRLQDLEKSEWSDEFEALMRNRLLMGALRYGPLRQESKKTYKRVESMIKRLQKYSDTGNKEFLVDVANLCLCEFVECKHPLAHFHAIDNNTEHVSSV